MVPPPACLSLFPVCVCVLCLCVLSVFASWLSLLFWCVPPAHLCSVLCIPFVVLCMLLGAALLAPSLFLVFWLLLFFRLLVVLGSVFPFLAVSCCLSLCLLCVCVVYLSFLYSLVAPPGLPMLFVCFPSARLLCYVLVVSTAGFGVPMCLSLRSGASARRDHSPDLT